MEQSALHSVLDLKSIRWSIRNSSNVKSIYCVVALLAGSCVTAILLNVLKKKLTDEEYAGGSVEEEEAEVDLSGISFE